MKLLKRRRTAPALHVVTELLEHLELLQPSHPDLTHAVAVAIDELADRVEAGRDGALVPITLEDGTKVWGFILYPAVLYAFPHPEHKRDYVVSAAIYETSRNVMDIQPGGLESRLRSYIEGLRNDPLTSIKAGVIQERISDDLEQLLKS